MCRSGRSRRPGKRFGESRPAGSTSFPNAHGTWTEERGRVDASGVAHRVEDLDPIPAWVCGSLGHRHAMGPHLFRPSAP
ncbi:MAG: hypothetical protein CL933_02565 [Deltaproteobacteria bacterium]|nr:hypothetical protein [Deltaproteobacteria bacterium]